ncbi:hypothetical protein GOODEAATRI_018845 [Goodea atripinnis]|uniref:von Willebrand factor n=1 Tax=Goodea atripinnis TaxID=208336 RepID=A0ABV0NVT9_9TELE
MCDRAMDLAFLLDGSQALTEDEFLASKEFIFRVVERFRMGSAHTRATVLLYHSGVKTYDLQVQKRLFKKILHDLHYTGGHAGFLDEAVKYLAINIYDKNKREHAGRVAIILTASGNPRPVRAIVKMLRKKAITTLTVALGPGVNMGQINDITKANPNNRVYVLSSTGELPDRLLEVTDYLCTLGMEPEVPKPPGLKPTPGRARKVSPITSPATYVETKPRLLPSTPASTPPSGLSLVTTVPPYHPPATDVTFIIEGSDAVGEANFTKSLIFVEEVISQLTEEEEFIRITVIQYSVTVTVEINRWELRQQKDHLLQRLREIRWRGGSKTNTGEAVTMTLQEMTTIPPPHGPTPPRLVFLVTENPPTDTVTRPPTTSTQTQVYPIGVGPKVHETDLVQFSHPQRPLMVEDYNHLTSLVHRVVNITQTTVRPRYPTLPPLIIPTHSTLPLTAVRFAVQASISSVSGGRVGVPKPGETWLLDDGCHSLLCHPSGAVTVQNHKISCDRLEPPACRNNMPPVRVEEDCGCRWECPCMCMGSSTNHVVRFDGLPLRLDREGLCSYTLLMVSKGNREGSEVKLHTGPCQDSAKYSQICMTAMEVTHGPYTLLLKDDITVIRICV